MSVRNLEYLFAPTSVAVIGASNRPHSVGAAVMRNLLGGGFEGPIMPVNPRHRSVAGVLAYPDVQSLPVPAELAVICTPAQVVPGIVAELGARGTRAVVVLTAGLSNAHQDDGRDLQQAMLDAAKPHLVRVLGPNCLGLMVPSLGLNASFAHIGAIPGRVALLHQSGALCTALLDWARSNNIGFSHFVSLGNSADVDFGDLLDHFGGDPDAQAILMYVESVKHARKFMSAARAAARNKPVVIVKAGRVKAGARAAASHTGALAGSDDVYDAAIRRAGMLRVYDTSEMFDAVETLSRTHHLQGERLAILTNGGGPGVMATDALVLAGGVLSSLDEATIAQLDEVLPATWSRGNPIDIIGDAGGDRYADALRVLLNASEVDAVLVMHAPTAVVDSVEVARRVAGVVAEHKAKPAVLASWLGGDGMQPARRLLSDGGIPHYKTPDEAVRAFMHLVRYRRNQEILMETPASIPEEFEPVTASARLVIENALSAGRELLTEPEAKAVLAAYGIPIVETRIAANPDDVARVAVQIGQPLAVKIISESITHKSDVGGVVLDIDSPEKAREAAVQMTERVAKLRPDAKISGFTVQPMARRPGAHELIVGAMTDPIFGPALLFGEGGTAVEIIADKAVALPPLNAKLARELVQRTRVAARLAGYRDKPPADLEAIYRTLMQVSQLICDVPEIIELDVNPLVTDEHGVLALDARLRVRAADTSGTDRLAIRPYPKELEEWVEVGGADLLLRPIRPEDEPRHRAFLDKCDSTDIRFRFFGLVRRFSHTQLARFTQIDYNREMAFVATRGSNQADMETVGVVRAVADPDNERAEFAIIISSDLKGQGLGRALLEKMIRYCRERGTGELIGEILPENAAMLGLAKRLGFESHRSADGAISVRLVLRAEVATPA